jgi:hypothetical protein
MPNILSQAVKTVVRDPAYTSDMAATKMGYGPGRPITTIPRRKQICSSGSRIFYKTLFLTGELQAEVRFLMRQTQCKNPLEV